MNMIQTLINYVISYKYDKNFKVSFIDKEQFGNIFLIAEIIYKQKFPYTILLYLAEGIPYWCVCDKNGKRYNIQASMTNYATVLAFIECDKHN